MMKLYVHQNRAQFQSAKSVLAPPNSSFALNTSLNTILKTIFSFFLMVSTSTQALASDVPKLNADSLSALTQKSEIVARADARGVGSNRVSIAILDNGFRGFQDALAISIPSTTRLHPGPILIDAKNEEFHGLKMAEIVSHLLDSVGVEYELHLYSAYGFSNLRNAIDKVIQKKHDLVLYAQVWEFGGNPDGSGFINSEVRRATNSGIKWINAAGNFARGVFLATVETRPDGFAALPGINSSLQLRCQPISGSKCRLRTVLSWSSFADTPIPGTSKDLDLFLEDEKSKLVGAGQLQQVLANASTTQSLYPREIIEVEIPKGSYSLRVKVKSGTFLKNDFLRITTTGDGIELLNRTEGESVMAPADIPEVITVGANDSRLSSFSRSLRKPNLRAPSLLLTEDASSVLGSSTAAAVATALAAFELSHNRTLTRQELQRKLQTGGAWNESVNTGETSVDSSSGAGNSSVYSEIKSHDGRNCLSTVLLRVLTPDIRKALRGGQAWSVMTNSGVKVVIDQDPIEKLDGQGKLNPGEILVLGVNRFSDAERLIKPLAWRTNLVRLASGPNPSHVEIVQLTSNLKICP